MVLRKDYGFDEAFNVFDEIKDKHIKLNEYKPSNSDKINTKNEMLTCLIEEKLVVLFFIPIII